MIICQTVPDDEQQVFVQAARGSDLQVYVLTELVAPEQFIARVQELAETC